MCPILNQRTPGDLATGSAHSRNRPLRASMELFPGLKVGHQHRDCFQARVSAEKGPRVAERKLAVRRLPLE